MKRISVLIADDHAIVREGLCKMLSLETDLEVIGEAEDGREAVTLATELRPDVVLMDIAMPTLNGLEATRRLLKHLPTARVLILSAHRDDTYVKSASESGGRGFLLKQASASEVCEGIRAVHQGETYFSPSIVSRLQHLESGQRNGKGENRRQQPDLTSRENEVLQLIAEGFANKQIASDLEISIKTVEKHRTRLMKKLDIHDTAGLTRHAISMGIIECSVQLTIEPDGK